MARRFKKVEGGHGHHGGAWKVAYADFVTAMMALFMVLWLLASTDAASRKEISNYFRSGLVQVVELPSNGSPSTSSVFVGAELTPPSPGSQHGKDDVQVVGAVAGKDGGEQNGGEGDKDNKGSGDQPGKGNSPDGDERARAVEQLENRLNRLASMDGDLAQVVRHVRVQVAQDGVLIEAVDEAKGLLFESSSAKLNEPLERFLRALGPAIATLDRSIEINGHTDARPFAAGAGVSNWDLSYQRAEAARVILESAGVSNKLVVGVFARGSSQLYNKANPVAPENRRLSILVKIAKNADKKPAPAAPAEPTEDDH